MDLNFHRLVTCGGQVKSQATNVYESLDAMVSPTGYYQICGFLHVNFISCNKFWRPFDSWHVVM